MGMPSASSLQRAIICQGSATLPRDQSVSEASDKGNIIHEYLAGIYNQVDAEKAPLELGNRYGAEAWKALKEFMALDLSPLPVLDAAHPEMPFAYDPATGIGRGLESGFQRDYSQVKDHEFPGTADLVGWNDQDRVLEIWDFKSGYTEVPTPKWNWQLRVAALACAGIFDAQRIRIGILKLNGQCRRIGPYEVTKEDLAAWRADLLALQQKITTARQRGENGAIVTGPHCKYCPAWNHCPAQTTLIKRFADPTGQITDINSMLTPNTAGRAAGRWLQVKELMRRMEQAFREYEKANGPISLANGQKLGTVTTRREEIDGAVAFSAIADKYGVDAARQACSFETSKAAIDRMLAGHVAKGGRASASRELLKTIREADGVVTKERQEFRVYSSEEES